MVYSLLVYQAWTEAVGKYSTTPPAWRRLGRFDSLRSVVLEAIRKIVKVKGNRLIVELPEDYNEQEVEVTIRPFENEDQDAPSPSWQTDLLSVSCWSEADDAARVQSWPLQSF